MKKNIRVDPLMSNGVVDTEYYGSSDYTIESDVVIRYLKAEGFDEEVKEFKIMLLDRLWWVSIN